MLSGCSMNGLMRMRIRLRGLRLRRLNVRTGVAVALIPVVDGQSPISFGEVGGYLSTKGQETVARHATPNKHGRLYAAIFAICMVIVVFAVIGIDDMLQSPVAMHTGQHIAQHIGQHNVLPSAGKIIHVRVPKIKAVFTAAHALHVHHLMHLHVLHVKHLAHELRMAHPEIML